MREKRVHVSEIWPVGGAVVFMREEGKGCRTVDLPISGRRRTREKIQLAEFEGQREEVGWAGPLPALIDGDAGILLIRMPCLLAL